MVANGTEMTILVVPCRMINGSDMTQNGKVMKGNP